MRPTAEGLEEENRKPKPEPKVESREIETPVEPNPVAAPEPLNETLSRVFDESPREWATEPEPTSPPPAGDNLTGQRAGQGDRTPGRFRHLAS